MKVLPVESKLVSATSEYHCIAPEPVALSAAVVPEQIVVPLVLGAAGDAFTVTATGVLAEEHVPLFSET